MAEAFKYSGVRKSHQSFNEVYFWTSVIKDWKHLLKGDEMKMIIIQSFQWLVQHELVYIYGYVIMDNHIHVLWEQLKMNGKETPKESFEKYTGHIFLKHLKKRGESLNEYAAEQKDRNYIFWQRDPLAIQITNRIMAGEKLDLCIIIHCNHIGNYVKTLLSIDFHQPDFMKLEKMNFKMLTHYMDKL